MFYNPILFETGTDLSWFWNKWYFDWGYIDLGIFRVQDRLVYVENEGGRPMAFNLLITFENGETLETKVKPRVWKDSSSYVHPIKNRQVIKEVRVTFQHYPDAVRENNVWRNEVGK